jgi:hypothetical protein
MPKKCILCENEAEYGIKGSSETYCKSCAVEQFQDVDYLQKLEDKAVSIEEDRIEEAMLKEEDEEEGLLDDEGSEE